MNNISKWVTISMLMILSFGSTSFANQSAEFQKMMELANISNQLVNHKKIIERNPNQALVERSEDPQMRETTDKSSESTFSLEGCHSNPKSMQDN